MRSIFAAICILASCGTDDNEPALFAANYAATYTQVRNCRRSLDHDLTFIRVLASADAFDAYSTRMSEFPPGSVVLKEQYSNSDMACAGEIETFTVMKKLPPGSSPATLDWEWQETDGDRKVVETNGTNCIRCHTPCVAPDGYDRTCTVP